MLMLCICRTFQSFLFSCFQYFHLKKKDYKKNCIRFYLFHTYFFFIIRIIFKCLKETYQDFVGWRAAVSPATLSHRWELLCQVLRYLEYLDKEPVLMYMMPRQTSTQQPKLPRQASPQLPRLSTSTNVPRLPRVSNKLIPTCLERLGKQIKWFLAFQDKQQVPTDLDSIDKQVNWYLVCQDKQQEPKYLDCKYVNCIISFLSILYF